MIENADFPRVVGVLSQLGQVFQVGQPFPNFDPEAATPVEGTVDAIVESPDDNDPAGTVFLITVRGGSPDPEFAWIQRLSAASVVAVQRAEITASVEAMEAQEEQDPDVGIDVRQVVVGMGDQGRMVALIYEQGRTAPELPSIASWATGPVVSIRRLPGNVIRARIQAKESSIIPAGTALTVTFLSWISVLELVPLDDLEREIKTARERQIAALEAALNDDDDDDDDASAEVTS